MTKESLQKLLSIALFLWGCGSVFATQPPAHFTYVAPQTVTTGFESVHFSDTSNESKPKFVENVSNEIIYISANTIFIAPEEVLQQAVVIHAEKIDLLENDVKFYTKTKRSVTSSKATICERNTSFPFRNLPNQNSDKIVNVMSSVVTSISKPTRLSGSVFPTNAYDILYIIRLPKSQSILQLTDLKSDFYQPQHTTRPPPFLV